jgi:hypothetical protein
MTGKNRSREFARFHDPQEEHVAIDSGPFEPDPVFPLFILLAMFWVISIIPEAISDDLSHIAILRVKKDRIRCLHPLSGFAI